MLNLMLEILHDYGYEVPQIGKNICCLFHEEDRASARLFNTGKYHCWSGKCGVHFNTPIDAIMHLENCDFRKALSIAVDKYGYRQGDKTGLNLNEFYSIQESIKNLVIKQKPQAFLSVYKTMDQLATERDLDKLKLLYGKLVAGEIK